MKAIILAAGEGSRLGNYTKELPKCMLHFLGKSLLERQIETYREQGIDDIVVVKKYMGHKINLSEVKYVEGAGSDENMVGSFFRARHEFNDDLIVSYGDIIFEPEVLESVIESEDEVGVAADIVWQSYWNERLGSIHEDSESFIFSKDYKLKNLGISKPIAEDMHARYIGLNKFSLASLGKINEVYDLEKEKFWNRPWYNSKSFKQGYMTDFIQSLIDNGVDVRAIPIQRGWLEFDTSDDYENYLNWHKTGKLDNFIKIK